MNEFNERYAIVEAMNYTSHTVVAYANAGATGDEIYDAIPRIHAAYMSIMRLGATVPVAKQEPAVPVKKSVTDDYIICLEDGKKFKSMRRHLSKLGMTPDDYRKKWELPADYPMTSPAYSAKRSQLAKDSGLGRK